MASHSGSSCLANPICTDKNITFSPSDYKNADMFRPILMYNGNSSVAPFTLNYGYLGAGPEGVLLELTAPVQTKIVSTEYILYGNMELTARHTPIQGLVFTFITMSDIKDEIDNEQTTSDGSAIYTNFFSEGQSVSGSSATITPGSGFDVSDWHTYGINWQQDKLQWTIDRTVVKTIFASSMGDSYPRSPSQVQISVWAGGNATNTQGVIDWAGGAIDWTNTDYTSNGYYSAEIKSFSVKCASQKVTGISTTGNGTDATSWVYTGKTSSSLNEPEFMLSTDAVKLLKDPSSGGTSGLPGYSTQSAFTSSNDNAWDGSGDTSGLSAAEIKGSSGSSSGGWLDNNKALSIAVPVAGVVAAIVAIWAIAVCCMKRRRRSQESAISSDNSGNVMGGGGPVMNIGSGGSRKSSAYSKLGDDDEDDVAPMGAQKSGQGYGPSVGPTPGPLYHKEYLDSTPTLRDTRGYASSGDAGYEAYAMNSRIASPNPYAPAGIRGPYAPASNAYTPAMNQTPAMLPVGGFTPAMAQSPAMRGYQQPGLGGYATPTYSTAQYPQRPLPQPQYQSQHQQQAYSQQAYPYQGYARQGYFQPQNRPKQQQQQQAYYPQGPYRTN